MHLIYFTLGMIMELSSFCGRKLEHRRAYTLFNARKRSYVAAFIIGEMTFYLITIIAGAFMLKFIIINILAAI
jgi:hypothetical protein